MAWMGPPGEPGPRRRTTPRLSRRRFLRTAALGVASAAAASALPACRLGSVADRPQADRSPPVDWERWWSLQERAGVLDFANWPYYIDRARGRRPSLELFEEETGIRVHYYRPIRDNATFLEKIRPSLELGLPTGYDLIVLTNGPELSELMRSGWLIPLDHRFLGRFREHAGPLVRNPSWDPGNRFTVAWQSGFTGMAYAPQAVEALGREPRSVQDLWDPRLAGRVGMMVDLMELGSFGLLSLGVDPSMSTPQDWRLAAERLRLQQRTVRPRYYDQGYLNALTRGDVWLTLAWSGDIFQVRNEGFRELRFVVPDEGAMLWTDNMMIPARAAHPVDAMLYMDFVYRPRIAAMIANWVGYVSPVPEARRIIAEEFGNERLANSPLVFPDAEILGKRVPFLAKNSRGELEQVSLFLSSRVRNYPVFEAPEEHEEWVRIFGPLLEA